MTSLDDPGYEFRPEDMEESYVEDDGINDVNCDPLQSWELIRLVRTAAGANLYVNSVAQSALGQANWGSLLGAAPDALGRLGQCFVLASDPLASSLVFPDHQAIGLKYPSLRANLVYCSNLGRSAFREAEAGMKNLSMMAEAVVEPDGTIDMVIQAVEDTDLAELDLPEQIARLKKISTACVDDTKAIKAKFDQWSEFTKVIYAACIAQDEDLGRNKKDITDKIEIKELAKDKKHAQLVEVKIQTDESRRQLALRQEEFQLSQKDQGRGAWIDLGMSAGQAIIEGAKDYLAPLSPLSMVEGLFSMFSPRKQSEHHDSPDEPELDDPLSHRDRGYLFAQKLLDLVQKLRVLVTDETSNLNAHGIDWTGLSGQSGIRKRDIRYFLNAFNDLDKGFSKETSTVTKQVRHAVTPAKRVAEDIDKMARSEREVGRDTASQVTKLAPLWREQVKLAETALANILEVGYEDVKKVADAIKKAKAGSKGTRELSRAEIRFKRFRMAQLALADAEERLLSRLEDDMKAAEEFNAMELELKKLLKEKATVAQVKEILGDCVKHLLHFCDKLDNLGAFFTQLQRYVETMEATRVDPFLHHANTTKTLKDRISKEESESRQRAKETVLQRKLDQLRLRALELKGYYLVAQAMADTYTEVSTVYIIPGVETISRLSLPDAKRLSKDERAGKVSEVGDMARRARDDVRRLANVRKRQLIDAMTENRGEIEEAKTLEI